MGMVLSLFWMYVLGARLILGTSQDLDQATEVWEGAVEYAQDSPQLRDAIAKIYRGNGNKTLHLEGGERYKVAAATRKSTRGKTSNLVLMDEIREHRTFEAWSAASKTTKAVKSGLVWCMSNAGDGTSVVLRHLRRQAHRLVGDPDGIVAELEQTDIQPTDEEAAAMREALSSIGIFEWSAPPGCSKWDRDAWAQANPSMNYGFLDESTIATDCASDPEDDFRVEDLCQWVTATVDPPFPVGAWDAGRDVDVSDGRGTTSVAACGRRADRDWHVELAAYRQGVGWVPGWFQNEAARGPIKVALQTHGAPVSSMAELIAAIDGVELVECKGPDVAGWSGRLWDAVAAGDPERTEPPDVTRVWHRTQPALDLAANVAATRPLGDGAWTWDRRRSLEDVSPLVAVTMAFGAATSVQQPAQVSAYEDHDLVFL